MKLKTDHILAVEVALVTEGFYYHKPTGEWGQHLHRSYQEWCGAKLATPDPLSIREPNSFADLPVQLIALAIIHGKLQLTEEDLDGVDLGALEEVGQGLLAQGGEVESEDPAADSEPENGDDSDTDPVTPPAEETVAPVAAEGEAPVVQDKSEGEQPEGEAQSEETAEQVAEESGETEEAPAEQAESETEAEEKAAVDEAEEAPAEEAAPAKTSRKKKS